MALFDYSYYPAFGVARLRKQKGRRWAELVDTLRTLPQTDSRVMAFTLTIRRLRRSQDLSQNLCRDPFCAICASHVVDKFKGSEQELVKLYYTNLNEIEVTLRNMPMRQAERVAAA